MPRIQPPPPSPTSLASLALALAPLALVLPGPEVAAAPPTHVLDLAELPADSRGVLRVLGAEGTGVFGVPVAGGGDLDGDGQPDLAVAHFTAPVTGFDTELPQAGEVDLIFLDATAPLRPATFFGDLTEDSPRLLRILGSGVQETAGNEIWIDDVTGDGLGDLLVGRQNFAPDPSRPGAGALTVIPGSPRLRELAEAPGSLDLARMDAGVADLGITTLWGAAATDRLGIWMRTGDVDGDGVADVVVGADQSDVPGPDGGRERNRGEAWVILGGPHLAAGGAVDLLDFHQPDGLAGTPLAGRVVRIVPPQGAIEFHLGATCQIAELDGDGRAEVLVAAALNRAGASLDPAGAPGSARPTGGAPGGRMWILWGESFPATPWPAGFTLDLGSPPASVTELSGGEDNRVFGEELGGGLDHDGDGRAELFVGDLTGGSGGLGYLFFDAAGLKGRSFRVDEAPAAVTFTTFLGPNPGAIAGDTIVAGDFDRDGSADLAYASPHADPLGRERAGTVHVIWGRPGPWPAVVDLRPGELPGDDVLRVTEIHGARGRQGDDLGDTLAYSAAAADVDGDGLPDLILNEMLGNGRLTLDVGNLLLLPATTLAPRTPPLLPRRLAP